MDKYLIPAWIERFPFGCWTIWKIDNQINWIIQSSNEEKKIKLLRPFQYK